MFAEVASKRMGSLPLNVVRMALSLVMLGAVMWCMTGVPYPLHADSETWIWMSLSGFVGYVLGDFCLFNSYILISSRFGQLLMTLSAPAAAVAGWLLLGEKMSSIAIVGMVVTMLGIGMSILTRSSGEGAGKKFSVKLNTKGVIFGVLAGLGQGVGLVLSAKGLTCYNAAIEAQGGANETIVMLIPFASTAMRAVTGLIGFSIWTALKGQMSNLRHAVTDRKAMLFTLGATIFGPFIGVSLSLMATLYTSTGIAQTIMATTPVLIILPSYFFFHQKVSVREIIGAAISVVGVALFFV